MLFSRRLPVWIIAVVASLLLGGCGLSLAEDVTPPPNYRPPTQAPEQPVASADMFPVVPPDPAQGKAIYEEKCLACHGATGMGDGEQADKLPNPAAPIGSAKLARQSTPIDWFNIVTNGNLERFMPGFTGSLNDRQRWDVVAYAFSLSTTAEELEQGQALYEANCATCHGITGKGDGEQAASLDTKPASWDDQSRLAKLSADNIVAVIGGEQVGHPSFADTLDEAQQYSVAAHLRQLSYAEGSRPEAIAAAQTPAAGTPEAGTPAGTQEAGATAEAGTPEAGTPAAEDLVLSNITITGKVTNATPGGSVPEDMEVRLTAYAGMSPAFEITAPVDENGDYIFNDVEFNPDFVYFAQADANGLTFNSDILHGADVNSPIADLSLKIFDTTAETTNLRTDRLHVFFDFTNPGTVQVVNLFIISNTGDTVVVPAQEGDPVVKFPLPEGASKLSFQDGQMGDRYVQTENGFGDRMSIAPGIGQHQILYAYELPYDRSLAMDLAVPLPVDAAIVMAPPGVRVKSAQLSDAGQRNMQGMAVQMYQANAALDAGDTLEINLSGKAGSDAAEVGGDSMLYVLIGGGVFGVALAAVGFWLYRRRSVDEEAVDDEAADELAEEDETSESLLEAIVALDDQHAAGGLPEEAYQERRADLKARLAEAVRREKGE